MRNESPLRNEPNKPLVLSISCTKGFGKGGKVRVQAWPKFANCFCEEVFTSTRKKDRDTFNVL